MRIHKQDIRKHESWITAIVMIAGFAMVAIWFATLVEPDASPAGRTPSLGPQATRAW